VLVLLSFALVLVATVLLVLGLLNDDGLTLIYASIASSALAAIVLIVALRRDKPVESGTDAPAPPPTDDGHSQTSDDDEDGEEADLPIDDDEPLGTAP